MDIAPLITTKTFTTFPRPNVDPTNAAVFRTCGVGFYHDGSFGFDIFGESFTTFSTSVFRHSGKGPLLTKVET
jgi:hypothetical protein